jgi:two-component system, cell cycle sensor histidine kinase and response regulator CckA
MENEVKTKEQLIEELLKMRGRIADLELQQAESDKLTLQLFKAQKLEAIGTLAGGIAHDFNNILGIIMGYTELAKLKYEDNKDPEQYIKEVLKACRRAKDLIRQILSFSHGGDKLERQVLYVRPIIKEVIKFLKASLPATIEVQQSIASETGIVFANPTQIYQVLTNLCTNAAHAMEKTGGILEVGLADVDLESATLPSRLDLKPGPYVRLTVADTGHGMDSTTLARIFDPYFTTKEPGKGSGLGLAVVHGIVKGHDGGIAVSSVLGKGTTFHLYLPRIETELTTSEEKPSAPVPTGSERILVVDDETSLVDIWKRYLELLGYVVVTKTSCLEALELFRVHPDYFDLVITDYTMPHMNGIHLARVMKRIQPNIPIIVCTGWREKITDEMNRETGVRAFLMKPLELRDAAEAIRKVLDEKK